MTTTKGYWQELAETVGAGWNRFWFTPADPLPLSLLRIGVGLLAAMYFLSFSRDLELWFRASGLLPEDTVIALVQSDANAPLYRFSLFYGVDTPGTLYAIHWLFVGAALCFAAGFLTRVSGVITLIGFLSYVHRAPLLCGPLDPILGMLLAYLIVGPAGAYFSVDRWLFRRGVKRESECASLSANIAIRLLQVHFAALVFTMGLAKISTGVWWEGEAIWRMMAQTISRPWDLTQLRGQRYLLDAWTHAIVYFEFLFPVLIWHRLARPLLLGAGAFLWTSIALVTGMFLFALGMILASLCFIPADTWRKRGIDPRPS